MTRCSAILFLQLFFSATLYSQVSIGSKVPDPSAMLDVTSSSKGMLVPRMTSMERNAIQKPASGLLVFQTDGSSGFYYYSGAEWKFLPPVSTSTNGVAVNATTPTTVTSVSGTTNRITSSGGTAPVINIATTYAGQTSITTLGTIATGTWNASVIPATKGGAGTVNGLLKANGTGTVSAAVAGTDYAPAIKLTTTGTSGAATYNATTGTINIPIYAGGTGGITYTFSSPLSLSGSTVSLPVATTTANGYLSSTDWNTFNNKLATASAAAIYAPINSPTFSGTVSGITKTMVGLGNVDNTSDVNKPVSTATQTVLNAKLTANAAIAGGTKTKITYDSKGLVTVGDDATTSDIGEGSNLYFTEARTLNSVLNGLSAGTNTSIAATDRLLNALSKLQTQIDNRALLIAKITQQERLAIQNPSDGLMVYQTDGTKGYWYYEGTEWKSINTTSLKSNPATTNQTLIYTISGF